VWRSIKHEAADLHACECVTAARGGIRRYVDFYNARRPHGALDGATPMARGTTHHGGDANRHQSADR
jgi:putative transposase